MSGETLNEQGHSTLLQMYQMAHNELLVRIQQRDQYYICILAAFIAVLVGAITTFSSSSMAGLPILLKLYFVLGEGIMCFFTYLTFNSCSIYEELIEHIREIEETLKNSFFPDSGWRNSFWQEKIDSQKPEHRKISFTLAKIVFCVLDGFTGIVIVYLWRV